MPLLLHGSFLRQCVLWSVRQCRGFRLRHDDGATSHPHEDKGRGGAQCASMRTISFMHSCCCFAFPTLLLREPSLLHSFIQMAFLELFLALFDALGEYFWGGVAPFEYKFRQHLGPILARLNALCVPFLVSSGTSPDCCPRVKAPKSIRSGVPHIGTINFQSTCVMTTPACTVIVLWQ